MHFGVMLQHFREHASPEAIRDVAQAAEALGYESAWVMDHVVIPNVEETRQFTPLVYDPLLSLAFVAGQTRRIRLGTTVLIVPYRHPLIQAKLLATLDALCQGRLTIGLGVGWLPQEFEALGVPFNRRGVLTDEYIAAMQRLWTGEPVAFEGRTVRFENVICRPRPLQRPHPPLWIGGSTEPALRRAVRFGAVWHPTSQSPESIERRAATLRRFAGEAGRSPDSIGIEMRATLHFLPEADRTSERHGLIGTADELRAGVGAYAAAGVQGIVLDTFYGSPLVEQKRTAEVIETLRRFAGEIMPE